MTKLPTIASNSDSDRAATPVEQQYYPEDLAEFVLPLLHSAQTETGSFFPSSRGFEMPSCDVLKKIISCAYQASLKTDEQRPVTFRLIFGAPGAYPRNQGPHELHT